MWTFQTVRVSLKSHSQTYKTPQVPPHPPSQLLPPLSLVSLPQHQITKGLSTVITMFFKNVLRRLTSFLLAHAPFAIFILVALPPLSNIVPPVLAVPAVTKSTTPHIPVDDFEEDEGFVVINLAPSKHCLSPSSRHINVRHTHTTQPTQPAVAAGDTATIANESSLSPVADDVPEPINSFLSISYSCTDLSQFLIEDRETSPACKISVGFRSLF